MRHLMVREAVPIESRIYGSKGKRGLRRGDRGKIMDSKIFFGRGGALPRGSCKWEGPSSGMTHFSAAERRLRRQGGMRN